MHTNTIRVLLYVLISFLQRKRTSSNNFLITVSPLRNNSLMCEEATAWLRTCGNIAKREREEERRKNGKIKIGKNGKSENEKRRETGSISNLVRLSTDYPFLSSPLSFSLPPSTPFSVSSFTTFSFSHPVQQNFIFFLIRSSCKLKLL